jgi:cytochrome P450
MPGAFRSSALLGDVRLAASAYLGQATAGSAPSLPKGQALARFHERGLYLASHPVAVLLGDLARRRGPLVTLPGLGHVVSSPELAREVFGDPERFSKTGPGAAGAIITQVMGPSALLNMDGAAHRELRDRLRGLFTARFVRELVDRVFEAPLERARRTLARGEAIDVVRLAEVLTGRMLCAMLGIELPEDAADDACVRLYRTGAELASVVTISNRRLGSSRLRFAKARFEELVREAEPAYAAGDESTVLGRLRALGLSFEESKGVAGILFLAGTETTATAIPRIVALLHDTDHWAHLRDRRELLRSAIDEGLRVTTPVPVMTRSVARDTELAGHRLRKDERLIIFMRNVTRDPGAFPEPRLFDLERQQPRTYQNLWFGYGPHFCLGFSVAQREIERTLTTLLDAGDLDIVRRRYGRRVLFPAYAELIVGTTPA